MSSSRPSPLFADLLDLASAALGGRAVLCSDDFFAPMEALVRPEAAAFDPDAYTERGKLMDGWESRRRRSPGHDWCIVALGVPGLVRGVDIDTSWFLGNHPPYGALEGCFAPGATPEQLRDEVSWTPLVRQVPLERGSHNVFAAEAAGPWTHVRLHAYPDGGIARLRVYGLPRPNAVGGRLDLAAAANGGRPVGCSDMFFSPMVNLIAPGRAATMGGGWETRRRRDQGHDWIAVALGVPGVIDEVVIDTHHFKGNFPHRASLETLWWPEAPAAAVLESDQWVEVLAPARLQADHAHHFAVDAAPATHARLVIRPCGGVSRLRLWGRAAIPAPDADPLLARLHAEADLTAAFHRCCGSTRWARAMADRAPFTSRAELYGVAAHLWWHLGEADWREAFTHHPRIGADPETLRARFASTAAWSAREQAGLSGAEPATLDALAAANQAYEDRFGFLFVVCASGLGADEMLARLRERLGNRPEDEVRVAAGEQAKITRLRLHRLAAPEVP